MLFFFFEFSLHVLGLVYSILYTQLFVSKSVSLVTIPYTVVVVSESIAGSTLKDSPDSMASSFFQPFLLNYRGSARPTKYLLLVVRTLVFEYK